GTDPGATADSRSPAARMGEPGFHAAQEVGRNSRALSQDEAAGTATAAGTHERLGEAYAAAAQGGQGKIPDTPEDAPTQTAGSEQRVATLPALARAAATAAGRPAGPQPYRARAASHGVAARSVKDAPCSGAPVSLFRRLSSLFYEMVLLPALLMIGTLPFVLLGQDADRIYLRPLLQLYLLALTAVYFAWQWLHGGQTLPMKTWRLKLVARDGGPLSTTQAVRRLIFALAG